MAVRRIDFGRGPVVIPETYVAQRDVDFRRAAAVVIYPAGTTAADLDDLILATADLVRASAGVSPVDEQLEGEEEA